VQSSLDYKQRLQQLFFPEGVAFDGNRFNRTVVTAELFKYWCKVRVLMKEWLASRSSKGRVVRRRVPLRSTLWRTTFAQNRSEGFGEPPFRELEPVGEMDDLA
jgi:hypothetical protein